MPISNRKESASDQPAISETISNQRPIFKLHHDLLWQIFSINAHMADGNFPTILAPQDSLHAPLTITRLSSQVCGSWRDLILASPSLWSGAIDFRFLNQKTDDWRTEVLRRTGSSLLRIKGFVHFKKRPQIASFFLLLCIHHWERIRTLEVYVLDGMLAYEAWRAIQRPTHNLEFFSLTFDKYNYSIRSVEKVILFGNDAPALRRFSSSNIPFILPAPWLSKIRILELTGEYAIRELLFAFGEMQLVQSMSLERTYSKTLNVFNTTISLPLITLPRLKQLCIRDALISLLVFLKHITPSAGCTLTCVTVGREVPPLTALELDLVQQVFSVYSAGYFNEDSASSLFMDFQMNKLEFYEFRDHPGASSLSRFRVMVLTSFLQRTLLTAFLRGISSSKFNHVKKLIIHVVRADIKPSDSDIQRFFSTIPSVTSIETDAETLRFILPETTPSQMNVIFPVLKEIKLASLAGLQDLIPQLLAQRKELGVPIKALDLRGLDSTTFGDLTFLDGTPSLRVIWSVWVDGVENQESYVCGTGNPGRLDWS